VNAAAAAAAAVKHTNAHTLRTPKHEGLHIMRRFNTTLPQSKRIDGARASAPAGVAFTVHVRLQRLLTEGQVQL
jgi:hypothetical protein